MEELTNKQEDDMLEEARENKEFNLSDKITENEIKPVDMPSYDFHDDRLDTIFKKDVKEFIKKLKEEIGNSDWYHKDTFETINKLAGDKLI